MRIKSDNKKVSYFIIASFTALSLSSSSTENKERINILLITADDMNFDSVGAFGCPVSGTTPNIDKLAEQGIRFTNAHVNVAVCQPVRGTIMTGMYGHVSGMEGFVHYSGDQLTLTEYLRNSGYMTAMLGKVLHSVSKYDTEVEKFDLVKDGRELGFGRDPQKYYEYAKSFFLKAKNEDKPFFMMANSIDPHRPFAGSDDEKRIFRVPLEQGLIPDPSRIFKSEDIVVPGFLPDIPDVRKEVAQYYSSVRRFDDKLGEILRALKESGMEDNTLVVFISDHGMALPFSKTNCYLNSTKTPFIAKLPGTIKPGIDSIHFISTIDFLPAFLEVAGLKAPENINGRSFLPLLKGGKQKGRDLVFTQFYQTNAKDNYPMRAVQNKQFGYIFNAWSDNKTVFKNESQFGLTFNAMKEAASGNEDIRQRVDLFLYRVPLEFYDYKQDPDALNNLIDDPAYKHEIKKMSKELEKFMKKTNDPVLEKYKSLKKNK